MGAQIKTLWMIVTMLMTVAIIGIDNSVAGQLESLRDSHLKLSSNKPSDVVLISSEDLQRRVIHCVAPTLPGTVDARGTIIVRVLINPKGQVLRAKAINGHPLLRRAAESAVKQWTFKPYIVRGKPKAVSGRLPINISWDKEETEKQCEILTRHDDK